MKSMKILCSMQSMELLLSHIREIKGVFERWISITYIETRKQAY